MEDPNQFLMEAFHHHGHPEATIDGEWVVMPGYPPARASAYPYEPGKGFVNLQLDVEIALDDGRVIGESVAGIGKDNDEALANGFSKFAANSLHVLLCAFYDYPVDEQVDVYEWEIHGDKWEVITGPFGVLHIATDGPVDNPQSLQVAPNDLFAFIEGQIKSRTSGDEELHWVRFFHGQHDDTGMESEVLWDNEVWQESQERLSRLDWPNVPGYTFVRSFTVLRKKGAKQHRGAAENAKGIEQALSVLLDYCGQHPDARDEAIYQHLVNTRVPPELADRVVVFGPMCFSSVLLRDIYPTEYFVHTDKPPYPLKKLDKEPVFAVGRRYAMAVGAIPERRNAFMFVASRCALFNAANQALNQGSKLEHLVASPPVVFLERSYENPLPEHERFSHDEAEAALRRSLAESARPDGKKMGKKKPWWQLW